MEEPLRKLGPYKLIREIGRGAFGTVWLAEKPTPIATMPVALKLAHNKDIDLEALKREAAIWLKAGGHPNVLRLIDADIYADQVFIVSEYASDGSLMGWLNRHGGRAPAVEAACEMIDGVLAGLAHLHERRVIHRDLKPDNILLQGNSPLLADFGVSRLLVSSSYSLTIGGTPVYMAPEAFDYKRNEQTDIWSVGIIFYQLLTGRLPYCHSDVESLKEAIVWQDPPPLPLSIPVTLRQIVEKALQRNPRHRYKSAAEMRHDLREAVFALRLAEQETTLTTRAESRVPTPVPTPPAFSVATPPPPARTGPAQRGAVPQRTPLKPALGQRWLTAFWLFWGEKPAPPHRGKFERVMRRVFWNLVKLVAYSASLPLLLVMVGSREQIRGLDQDMLSSFILIPILFVFMFVFFGTHDAVTYLRNPTEEPERLNEADIEEWLWDTPESRRRRAVAGVLLLIEIVCVVGKFYWWMVRSLIRIRQPKLPYSAIHNLGALLYGRACDL